MDLKKLETRLVEMSKDPGLREAVAMDGGMVVLASHASGAPAISVDWTWFIDQLPTLIPIFFSVISSGGATAFIPVIVQIVMKLFKINQTQAQVMLTQALAATQGPG